MARATWVFAATSLAALAAAIWLYLDNRELRDSLASARATSAGKPTEPAVPAPAGATDTWSEAAREPTPKASVSAGAAPALPDQPKETRLERRQRRLQEFSAMFGRIDGETEEEYRSRVIPMMKAGLLIPRQRVEEQRKQIEEKAGVTPEQSKKLDQAFEKVYEQAIDYTNKAIADGTLSPYERNVSGWLEFAGGLGGILGDANSQIGKILTPQQMSTIASSGFEWGEYLGALAPWESLNPPPPPR